MRHCRALRLTTAVVVVLAAAASAVGIGVQATPNEPVAVDEPQYLLTAQSLARDGDLDIANQLAAQTWREFTATEPPVETLVRPDGSQISPHDPLLPILLAVPVGLGGWVAAKLFLSVLAGILAGWTLWLAVRRFAVPLPLATVGVGVVSLSAPLAVYGQQIYPELPAALAAVAGVTALTGLRRSRELALLAIAVTALPWLSVKYTPVAAALALLGLLRWWRAGRHRAAVGFAGGLALLAGLYLVTHVVVWGGVTVYASGDHFQQVGQLGVMGTDPNYLFRSWRLIDLLVDSRYGLVTWQPAWLLLVPALAGLAARRWANGPGQLVVLGLPLAAGWLVATYAALTMHGYWWPGRQLVVVLPLAVLVLLCWLAQVPAWLRVVAGVLGAAGVFTYGCVLVDGHTDQLSWVRGFFEVDAPVHQLLVLLLADYGDAYSRPVTASNVVWLCLLAALAIASYAVNGRRQFGSEPAGKNDTVPSTLSPTSSSTTSC